MRWNRANRVRWGTKQLHAMKPSAVGDSGAGDGAFLEKHLMSVIKSIRFITEKLTIKV